MDVKVSRKETRLRSWGPVDVLVDNIFDLYPVYADAEQYVELPIYVDGRLVAPEERKNIIMDIETLDDEREELLDRAMWALVKQRGQDPTEPADGIQWAEAVIGEVAPPIIMQQVQKSVHEEGPGVRITPSSANGKLIFNVELTSTL